MVGFIMSVSKGNIKKNKNNLYNPEDIEKRLEPLFTAGIYSTLINQPKHTKKWNKNMWQTSHEGTFNDYVTMKPGDNIYFFIDRKIYGIGKLKKVGFDCKYKNYPKASQPYNYLFDSIKNEILFRKENDPNYRWICTFEPNPYFFKKGVDMDEALSSAPGSFRMLRAFWKKSFIKIDDEENSALKDLNLKANQKNIHTPNTNTVFEFNSLGHRLIDSKLKDSTRIDSYLLDTLEIVRQCIDGEKIAHEMALEGHLLHKLDAQNPQPFLLGKWDYISHQVIASPHKPVDYMDAIDIFGYKFLKGYNTIYKYCVIEVKAGSATKQDINQLMKYVDWVAQEYAHGDYSMIEASLITNGFNKNVIDHQELVGRRQFAKGNRPTYSAEWSSLNLVKYWYDGNDVNFKQIN
ncbi:hypothetical protein [Pontibacillus yanchengensis]|uniref:hypothetical protein n=1 Tax=Pontibacillus yanchengensis TaxID=462910 RepID=UPI001927BF9C|nr:hypothetical protein [Pontibacillus yanchengensis]